MIGEIEAAQILRVIGGRRLLGFRGLFLRRWRRHLDAIHLHEPAALEVIDAGPRAALITQDRGAIAVGIPAELNAVRRAGAGDHFAFGHAETDTLAKRRRACARDAWTAGWATGGRLRRRRGRTAAAGIDQIAIADRPGLPRFLQVGISVAAAAA